MRPRVLTFYDFPQSMCYMSLCSTGTVFLVENKSLWYVYGDTRFSHRFYWGLNSVMMWRCDTRLMSPNKRSWMHQNLKLRTPHSSEMSVCTNPVHNVISQMIWKFTLCYLIVIFNIRITEIRSLRDRICINKYRVTQKTETFENPPQNWRNPRKKNYWQKLNHYNLPFKRQ